MRSGPAAGKLRHPCVRGVKKQKEKSLRMVPFRCKLLMRSIFRNGCGGTSPLGLRLIATGLLRCHEKLNLPGWVRPIYRTFKSPCWSGSLFLMGFGRPIRPPPWRTRIRAHEDRGQCALEFRRERRRVLPKKPIFVIHKSSKSYAGSLIGFLAVKKRP